MESLIPTYVSGNRAGKGVWSGHGFWPGVEGPECKARPSNARQTSPAWTRGSGKPRNPGRGSDIRRGSDCRDAGQAGAAHERTVADVGVRCAFSSVESHPGRELQLRRPEERRVE